MGLDSKTATLEIPGYTPNLKLAEGGCAEIYSALEHATGNLVAIKILHPRNLQDKTERKRLLNEGKIWLRLGKHENIVQTYKVETVEGMPFLVQEYIDGFTLRELLSKQGSWDEAGILKLAKGLCRALRFIHNAGIVHKDLKPDNIMITRAGRIKVLDFGFAENTKAIRFFGRKTLEGSPAYMAPELFAAKRATVATDIYALGCTLYEAATGSPPFTGMSHSMIITLQTNMELRASPFRAHNKQFSHATETMILKACEKDASKRYKFVEEILLDIARNPLWHKIRAGESHLLPVKLP